ncbi:MAG: ATP-binding protein [Cyanobacteria bacterium SBLK]|nr:ATP-binding protein [Cyanobacteria bacterium SBLK]
MQAIIFIGLQASGKSTFYRDYFLNTHIRINLDMLKTRHRETILLNACLEAKQSFVIDNTNPLPIDRQRYLVSAQKHRFQAIAYYFQSDLEACKARNQKRSKREIVPLVGILATSKKLVIPSREEGFDRIYTVKIGESNTFTIEEWSDEV